jgi:leucine dehydrogenase
MSQTNSNSIFDAIHNMGHEQLMFFNDAETGLRGIIGIHNTTLGPALGGTRVWRYNNEQEAINDVLRLSRGMTFKSAISGINLGGGKAVIIDSPQAKKDEAFWRRYGKFVDNLGGKYITAEDVGTNTRFMEWVAQETNFVAGKPDYLGGGGDPSPVTAYGVYLGIKASQNKLTGSDSLANVKVAVQGVGSVGRHLIDFLVEDGAEIIISDINEENIKAVTAKHKVTVVGKDEIYGVDADIYAPCALGATINDATISQFKFSIIAGAANNQLEDEQKHGSLLRGKGIIYAPDFLINAGGVINCYAEVHGYNRERAMGATENIYYQTLKVLKQSEETAKSTHEVALEIAMERIRAIGKINQVL